MKKELKEKIELVAEFNFQNNGYDFFLNKLQEELEELLEEIKSDRYFYVSWNKDMVSEIADVKNLIEQIEYIGSEKIRQGLKEKIEKEQLYKINRTIERYNIK
jgi:hypothetical protein